MYLIFFNIFLLLFCFSPLTFAEGDYEIDHMDDPAIRELATANQAFQDHINKNLEYYVNMLTPGYHRKKIENYREFDPSTNKHYVRSKTTRQWKDGSPIPSKRYLDFYIKSDSNAFFSILLPGGVKGFTKDGRFRIDFQNQLVTLAGNFPVLGENGPINVISSNPENFTVSRSGAFFDQENTIGKLLITVFNDFDQLNTLISLNGVIYYLPDNKKESDYDLSFDPQDYAVMQGWVMQGNTFPSMDSWFFKRGYQYSMNAFNKINTAKRKWYSKAAQ